MAVKKKLKAGPATAAATTKAVAAPAGEAGQYNGYCVKCKEKRDYQGVVVVSKTGMNMAQGSCPVCGTKVSRILGKAKG